jgi:hypothetical protein
VAKCKKETEIELSNGKVVDVEVIVEGYYDKDDEAGQPGWYTDNWNKSEFDKDDLTKEEIAEVWSKIEEFALDNEWDYGTASDDEEADDYEPPEEL